VGVAVEPGWRAVSRPAGVRNAAVGVEGLGKVKLGLIDELLQLRDLADLLEGEDLILLVAIDSKTGRVIATILETEET